MELKGFTQLLPILSQAPTSGASRSFDNELIVQMLDQLWWIRVHLSVLLVLIIFFIAVLIVATYRTSKMNPSTEFFERGNRLLMKGSVEELLALCDKHLIDYPADAGAYWLKACAHYRRDEWNKAITCYRRAGELQPGWAIGPPIAEIEERIAAVGKPPDLKVVAPITPIQGGVSSNTDASGKTDA